MKKILSILFILCSVTLMAQRVTYEVANDIHAVRNFTLPSRDTTFTPDYIGQLTYRSADNSIYLSIALVGQKWVKQASGGTNIYNSDGTATGDRVADWNSHSLQIINTTAFSISSSTSMSFTRGTNRNLSLDASAGVRLSDPDSVKIWTGDFTKPFLKVTASSLLGGNIPVGIGTKALRYNPSTSSITYADTTTGGGGSGSPAGSSGDFQYNNSGSFGGTTGTTYSGSGNNVTMRGQNASDTVFTIIMPASATGKAVIVESSTRTPLFSISKGGSVGFYGGANDARLANGIAIEVNTGTGMGIIKSVTTAGGNQDLTIQSGNLTISDASASNEFHSSGKIKVGNGGTPTARVHIVAGTATASSAPLKFTSGTNLTTPEDGAVEYDGTNYFGSVSTTRYSFDKSLTGSAALDFPSTGAGAIADLTITVTGAALGNVILLGVPNASVTATATYTAWVSATNTVTVRFSPKATEDPASGTFNVRVVQ